MWSKLVLDVASSYMQLWNWSPMYNSVHMILSYYVCTVASFFDAAMKFMFNVWHMIVFCAPKKSFYFWLSTDYATLHTSSMYEKLRSWDQAKCVCPSDFLHCLQARHCVCHYETWNQLFPDMFLSSGLFNWGVKSSSDLPLMRSSPSAVLLHQLYPILNQLWQATTHTKKK